MLVVHRFIVAGGGGEPFLDRARAAVAALAGRPGYQGGWIGRAPDEPSAWIVATAWDGVGSYRRALSSYDAKVGAHPLLAEADGGPSAFEVIYADVPGAPPRERDSGLADDAATASPGQRVEG
ncbi:MAG: antibiotic biosynthesis monooxygenase [Frankiaceae bacterium]